MHAASMALGAKSHRSRPSLPLLNNLKVVSVENVSSAEVIRRLQAAGWTLARVKGSHHHFKHSTRAGLVTVPHPKKELPLGTLKSIERQSGVKLT